MQTQQELELSVYGHGRDEIRKSIERNEKSGHADANPYAQRIYREFLFPLRDAIVADLSVRTAGRRKAHAVLLAEVDKEACALIAVRQALATLTETTEAAKVARSIGRSVYHEYLLTQFSDAKPELFYHLLNDIDRRMSSDERYKMAVMRNQAQKHGVNFQEWGDASVFQVGYYLLDQLRVVGMVELEKETRAAVTKVYVQPTARAEAVISQIKDFVIEMAPYNTPCIEPPKDWVSLTNGGYHTEEMRRLDPYLVHTHSSAREAFERADLTQELRCINALQRTAWRVNRDLLDIVSNVSQHHDMKEVMLQGDMPKPQRPHWLRDQKPADMTPEQLREFRMWKREVAGWHTDERVRRLKGRRFDMCMRSARQMRDYPALYFVYFMDFRGRKYVKTNGISPQGSDLQKALIHFSVGKPLLTAEAKRWFTVTGANRFGVDKCSYDERVQWVKDNEHLILDWARNPVDSVGWMEADKPFQFLAWCLEYAQWKVHGDRFLSRVSVGMDGTCNGLQNFSAMLRDPVGGVAVNLTPGPKPNDIYNLVALRTTERLQVLPEDEHGYRTKWLDHVLTRGLVKRSVMTLPYGSKRVSCRDFIIADYLKEGKFPELPEDEWFAAADYLSKVVWEAIADVVVAARAAMEWLQKVSGRVLKRGAHSIRWVVPTGFPVVQMYWGSIEHRIHTKLMGNMKIKLRSETDEVNVSRHRNGIAPNFVHSLDASHLCATTNACADEGVTAFHMVHDDYGTHAADADTMYRCIRSEFVRMYSAHDMLQELADAYGDLPEPPPMGTLDLNSVLESPYFFG